MIAMPTECSPLRPGDPLDRAALARYLDWIIANHVPCFTEGNAGLRIAPAGASFDRQAAEMEGYARLLWGLAPALAGGTEPAHAEAFLEGLANGVNPSHHAYWGEVGDFDQRIVEMAAIATLIHEAPHFIARLTPTARDNLCCWLARVQTAEISPNNWRFFRVLVMKALQRLEHPIDEALLATELDFVDSQYVDAGWYADGKKACFDYYNGFAFQFYALLYARWYEHDDRARCQRFVARAQEFARSYRYWFADNGVHIAYGRSMLYRFAPACFWGALAHFGHPDITMGQLCGLWSRAISWWLDKPIFDGAGRITLGYAYPSQLITEFYNSAQSPLWALKAFFPLALPAEHPFWQTPPEPLSSPAEGCALPLLRHLLQRRHGEAYLITGAPCQNEIRLSADKYSKFAYSTAHGLSVEGTRWISSGFCGDNLLALSADKENWFFRTNLLESYVVEDELHTVWSPFEGCHVHTRQRFVAEGELRIHEIENTRELDFVASGHAVDLWRRANRSFKASDAQTSDATGPVALGETLFSDIREIEGEEPRGRHVRTVMPCAPNTNLMFPYAAVPVLIGTLQPGRHCLETILSYGRRVASPHQGDL